jgi:DNA-binding CsgD family transcriptional regulator
MRTGIDMRWISELTRIGLWAAADIGTEARARAEVLYREFAEHAQRRRDVGTIFEPEIAASLASADAELGRMKGSDDAALWAVAADAWTAIPEPYPAAYSLYRQAEALVASDRKAAEEPLRSAFQMASKLGAQPLLNAIQVLAARGGIALVQGPARERTADSYGLTAREREVLTLMARGASDREIAEQLFISPKTASVHVSNVKGKLGAASRIEAATIGVRMGLAGD